MVMHACTTFTQWRERDLVFTSEPGGWAGRVIAEQGMELAERGCLSVRRVAETKGRGGMSAEKRAFGAARTCGQEQVVSSASALRYLGSVTPYQSGGIAVADMRSASVDRGPYSSSVLCQTNATILDSPVERKALHALFVDYLLVGRRRRRALPVT